MSGLELSAEPFGALPDGRRVTRYAFGDRHALYVRMLNFGATLQTVEVPDSGGRHASVILGLPTLDGYRSGSGYLGATVGRYANRIAGGRFALDGRDHQLVTNEGANTLHGGSVGFDKRLWDAEEVSEPHRVGVRFSYVSADGEMGFPGELTAHVTYTVDGERRLAVEYEATSNAPTVVNLTNHAYFNLAGEGSGTVHDQLLWLAADRYLPTDAASIPLGEAAQVAGTPFDFREPTPIGARISESVDQLTKGRGYDHNWVLEGTRPPQGPGTATETTAMPLAAWAHDPASGRTLECWTTEPGVQFYSGNFLDGGLVGVGGKAYRRGGAFTLETQHPPDAPNQPSYPSTVLRPGQRFTSATVFRFSS